MANAIMKTLKKKQQSVDKYLANSTCTEFRGWSLALTAYIWQLLNPSENRHFKLVTCIQKFMNEGDYFAATFAFDILNNEEDLNNTNRSHGLAILKSRTF